MSKKKKKDFKPLTINPIVSSGEPVAITEFKRPRWKHFLRLLTFTGIILLYIMFGFTSYNSHIVLHHGFSIKEGIAYILALAIAVPIIPSVLMEADYVKIEPDGLLIKNLIYRTKVAWEDITKFSDPLYLKFGILRTKKAFFLLNRRDLPNYNQLVETIREKGVQPNN